MAIAPYVSKYLLPYSIASLKVDVKGMQEIMMRKYGIYIPDHICWRERRMMKDAVDGKHEEGYKYLAHYTGEFKAKNPGSVTFITWAYQGPTKNPMFKHMLIYIGNYKGLEKCYAYCFKENICHLLLQKFCITLSRCKTCKHLGHNAEICGRPRDKHYRLSARKKRIPTERRVPKRWGRRKK
ncbi:hypothetical protein Cgig2_002558 [Carnegiea gigantea]|uniref:Uncharacterized protein n=1 Tax=Carnegiea gigantea TaxID=171969 RepID=A0A9Q1GL45_9CARY|nr:hypothetical protein Cgig2_002558 [Carnegiea gigantea]